MHWPDSKSPNYPLFTQYKWIGGPNAWAITPQWSWAGEDPVDPAKFEAYKTNAVALIRSHYLRETPDIVAFYPEPHISRDLTAGSPSDYWGEPVQYTVWPVMWFRTAKSYTNLPMTSAMGAMTIIDSSRERRWTDSSAVKTRPRSSSDVVRTT